MDYTDDGISIKELFDIVFKNIILIIAITFAFAVVGLALAITKDSVYQVQTTTLVNISIGDDDVSSDGVTTTLRLLETIQEWFSTELVLSAVREEMEALGMDIEEEYTKKNIESNITSSSSTSNLFIKIYYEDKDVENAVIICNLIMTEGIRLWSEQSDLTGNTYNTGNATTFVITDTASVEESEDVSMSGFLYVLISAFVGGIISLGLVIVKELSSNVITNKEQVEKISGMKIVAVIPNLKN